MIDYALEYKQALKNIEDLIRSRDHYKRNYQQAIVLLAEANEEIKELRPYKAAYVELCKEMQGIEVPE